MIRFRLVLGAALLGVSSFAVPILGTPAAAASVDNSDPARFIETLSAQAFQTLHVGSKASARGQFRSLLGQYFAVDEIGDRLIRRWRPQISPTRLHCRAS